MGGDDEAEILDGYRRYVARLFALTVRNDIGDWQTGKAQRGWKALRADLLHLPLRFLGRYHPGIGLSGHSDFGPIKSNQSQRIVWIRFFKANAPTWQIIPPIALTIDSRSRTPATGWEWRHSLINP